MPDKKPRFGQGMGNPRPANNLALAVTSASERLPGAMLLNTELIKASPRQIRTNVDAEQLQELIDDIRDKGILQSLVVRELDSGEYELVVGQRRLMAAIAIGMARVPVIVKQMTDKEARLSMLAENLQRESLSDADERVFFVELQNEFNYSIKDIAGLVHKSTAYVSRLLNPKPAIVSDENHETYNRYELSNVSQSVTSVPSPRSVRPAFNIKPAHTANRAFQRLLQEDVQEDYRPQIEETVKQLEETVRAFKEKWGIR